MQLFGNRFDFPVEIGGDGTEAPMRSTFNSYFEAMLTIFQVRSGSVLLILL